MTTLLERIAEARAAHDQIQAMNAVRTVAEELPLLLEQQEREARIEAANIRLEQVRANVKAWLEEARSGASKFRETFAEVALEFEALVAAMPVLQGTILAAGRSLQSAVETAYKAEHGETFDPQKATGVPAYLLDNGDLAGEWEKAGGTDPALACLPEIIKPGTIAATLAELLQRKSVPAYNPKMGARVFISTY